MPTLIVPARACGSPKTGPALAWIAAFWWRASRICVSSWAAATFGHFSGVTGQFTEEGAVLQEWYLINGVALLYCTYVCDVEDAGMDMPAVEEILGTLVSGDALLVD